VGGERGDRKEGKGVLFRRVLKRLVRILLAPKVQVACLQGSCLLC
jgi:hypothetical protein